MVVFRMGINLNMRLISMTLLCCWCCMGKWTRQKCQLLKASHTISKYLELMHGSKATKIAMVVSQHLIRTKMMISTSLLNWYLNLQELIKVHKYSIHLVPILLVIYYKVWGSAGSLMNKLSAKLLNIYMRHARMECGRHGGESITYMQ